MLTFTKTSRREFEKFTEIPWPWNLNHDYNHYYHYACGRKNSRLIPRNNFKQSCHIYLVCRTRKSQHPQQCKNLRLRCSFVSRDLDLWSFDSKINGFLGLTVVHIDVKFGDSSCSGFWDIVRINRPTDRQTNDAAENTIPRLPLVWVIFIVLASWQRCWGEVTVACATRLVSTNCRIYNQLTCFHI